MGIRLAEISPSHCSVDSSGEVATLRWETTDDDIEASLRVSFSSTGDLEMWPEVIVGDGAIPPDCFVFPVLAPATLSESDRLVFPAHSGWLISDPLRSVSEAIYPDGFHGLSTQLMAYFADGVGGFYMASHDPHVTHKKFTFREGEMSIRHDTWDLREGKDLDLGYPIVVKAMHRGTWFEAANHYREWALTAPWSRQGPNATRAGKSRPAWLFDKIGLSIWGTPSSLDWSRRYEALSTLVGLPMHVVAGWDWPATRPHYVGKEGWFPARFHEANLEVWKDHFVTPYMNDLFISRSAQGFMDEWEPNLVFPYKTFSFTYFSERAPAYVQGGGSGGDPNVMSDVDFFVCPCTSAQHDLHTWRDSRLVGDYGLDGVFYDISSGNPFAARCLRSSHGHTPGWSREVLRGYAANNAASRTAMTEATGRIPGQGVETIVEHVIEDVDFYVSRSVAGPVGGLEAFTLGPETEPGRGRELIPLFQAVYHDVGPVHEDGWLTFADTNGDIFFWITARLVVTWGGVLSLHYANNPPEQIGDLSTGEVISWDGGHHVFEDLDPLDPGFVRFAAEMGRLRLEQGNRYLAYGRMLEPVEIESPEVKLEYHRANPVMTGLTRDGQWRVPAVVHGAWESPEGSVALFLVNVGPEPFDLDTVVDTHWPLDEALCSVVGGEGSAGLRDGRLELSITLPSRSPVMIEMKPNRGA